MISHDHQQTALSMIEAHGLQAQAIANEHLLENRQRGDTAEIERWQDILAAIAELRRTAPASKPRSAWAA